MTILDLIVIRHNYRRPAFSPCLWFSLRHNETPIAHQLTMNRQIVLTVIADDKTGLVELLAATIRAHGGNWLESNMARLAGKFAGILLVDVAEQNCDLLISALLDLENKGLRVAVAISSTDNGTDGVSTQVTVTANDRPGIVGEISSLIAAKLVNVERLSTHCDNAPMSGEPLFHLWAVLHLPQGLSLEELQDSLESLSDDLIVEFTKASIK
jgi:glycine cleavage system regulatory protein